MILTGSSYIRCLTQVKLKTEKYPRLFPSAWDILLRASSGPAVGRRTLFGISGFFRRSSLAHPRNGLSVLGPADCRSQGPLRAAMLEGSEAGFFDWLNWENP